MSLAVPMTPGAEFMRATYEIARKEVMQHLRTKRLLIIASFLVVFLFIVTMWFGPHFARSFPSATTSGVSKENIVLMFYFGVGLVGGLQFTQLLSIVLTSDAVCSEWSNKTVFLLLSKPVSRLALVMGKFLGNLATIGGTLVGLFIITYVAMQPVYDGSPTSEEVAGFFGMLGVIVLGAAAFAAISLFLSTLSKSTVTSLLLMLSLWLLVFPVLGNMGFFLHFGERDFDTHAAGVQGWRYLNPAADMQAGAQLLLPSGASRDTQEIRDIVSVLNPFATAADSVGIALLALGLYTVGFVALSALVVRRRNFE